ncbi:hypothetical protein AJ80_02429 [Polytolypa hystricis UAMH7299]|uniref:Uncharacterized protein n=1 Tax=Polytolypa hystricis (strain UAMH7299) TaxID=1447883 RepID=A0A2B7YQA1_POLH7|nr:hypothetical protein AJ80_02429 [Polytolypa hystricis UAMH7299]
MSDTEEKPKSRARPQSLMAQNFSAQLDSLFMLDSDVDTLAQSIHYNDGDKRKQMVTIQSRELEALQAKIREAEERLKERETLGTISDAGSSKQQSSDDTENKDQDVYSPTSDSSGHPSEGGGSATTEATSNDDHDDQDTIKGMDKQS